MTVEELVREALERHQNGSLFQAEKLYLQALALEPENLTARRLLGVIRHQQGRNIEALDLINAVIEVDPGDSLALTSHGVVLNALGRSKEALSSFSKALAIKPGNLIALYNRGTTMLELKQFQNALTDFDEILAIAPDHTDAMTNRGNALLELKRFEHALVDYNKVLSLKPTHSEALNNRGVAFASLKRFEDSLSSYDEALAIHADSGKALYNRSCALWSLKRFDEALAGFDKIIAADPHAIEALYRRGNVLMDMRRFEDAIDSYERVVDLAGDRFYTQYALEGAANAARHLCNWRRYTKFFDKIQTEVVSGSSIMPPFVMLAHTDDASLQYRCARSYIKSRVHAPPAPLWNGVVYNHTRIRIAYISSDFNQHPVAYQLVTLFERHDRSRFEIFGISIGYNDDSAIRARISKAFDHFYDAQAQSDSRTAELLRGLEIDVAVDLGGHTRDSRLEILSHRPCPVQVSYLGYPGTTGADYIDYVVGDPIVTPFSQQPYFSEKIVHVAGSFWPSATEQIQETRLTRADAGLPEEGFIFCCLNSQWKLTEAVFDVWMRLLRSITGSVLWLKVADVAARKNLQAAAGIRGVDPSRLYFASQVPRDVHLARYRLADLFLDTTPYNAHATANEALWAGLPMITCRGNTFASRVAASLLGAVELSALVTDNLTDYESLALRLAQNPSELESLKEQLEQQRSLSPLFNMDRIRSCLETVYTEMTNISRRGDAPVNFAV